MQVLSPAGTLGVTVTVTPPGGHVPPVTVTVCAGGCCGQEVPSPLTGVEPVHALQVVVSRAKSGLAFANKLESVSKEHSVELHDRT